MTTRINNKKLVALLIFLLCAGCFHEDASTPPVKTSKQMQDYNLSVVSGENIQVHAQETSMRLIPTKGITFVDELHGYGLSSGTPDFPVLQSSDGGVTWQTLSKLTLITAPTALSFLDSRTGWLLTNLSYGDKSELRLTSDGGQTWEVIAQDLPGLEIRGGAVFFRFFDRYKGLIAAKSDKDIMLLRTQDGGLTWTASSRIPLPTEEKGVFTFLSATEGWFISSSKKDEDVTMIYHMTDGERWQEAGKLPSLLSPQAISFTNSQKGIVLLCANPQSSKKTWQLLRTIDGGRTWTQHDFPSTFQPQAARINISFPTADSGWLLDARDLWKTTDGGLSWSLLTP